MVAYRKECGRQRVRVILEFPEQSDDKAMAEFIGRLKEIYLGKIEIGSMQSMDTTESECYE